MANFPFGLFQDMFWRPSSSDVSRILEKLQLHGNILAFLTSNPEHQILTQSPTTFLTSELAIIITFGHQGYSGFSEHTLWQV